MARGRKPIRHLLKPILVRIVTSSSIPLSINKIQHLLQNEIRNYKWKVSWNTVKKYLDELVNEGILYSKKTTKVTYYWFKPIPW